MTKKEIKLKKMLEYQKSCTPVSKEGKIINNNIIKFLQKSIDDIFCEKFWRKRRDKSVTINKIKSCK